MRTPYTRKSSLQQGLIEHLKLEYQATDECSPARSHTYLLMRDLSSFALIVKNDREGIMAGRGSRFIYLDRYSGTPSMNAKRYSEYSGKAPQLALDYASVSPSLSLFLLPFLFFSFIFLLFPLFSVYNFFDTIVHRVFASIARSKC